jgi:hypothetical protein
VNSSTRRSSENRPNTQSRSSSAFSNGTPHRLASTGDASRVEIDHVSDPRSPILSRRKVAYERCFS